MEFSATRIKILFWRESIDFIQIFRDPSDCFSSWDKVTANKKRLFAVLMWQTNYYIKYFALEFCTRSSFCTRARTGSFFSGPDPTDTFKNLINFSNFYFIINIKNIQTNSIFSSTPMGDESLNHHQIHFDSIFSVLIIVKN